MKVGSLFTGYGGLDMAVGGDLLWYSEIDKAACKVLQAHYPDVPNLGDITAIDWDLVEPVDVITGGYPCQPFSTAGKRKGTNDDRHLWPYVRDAISAVQPAYAVLENVRGHLSLGLANVIGDLASLGYDTRWGVVRAADAGAPHNRARVFIVADTNQPSGQTSDDGRPWARNTGRLQLVERGGQITADTSSERHGSRQTPASLGRVDGAHEASARQRQRTRQESGTGSAADAWNANSKHDASQQAGHGQSAKPSRNCSNGGQRHTDWGQYEPAIRRWEHTIGRSAPAPTIRVSDRDRLSPAFVEWMMGLPAGHVTGHGLSPSAELKMLGNGVVPQQARLALELLGGIR